MQLDFHYYAAYAAAFLAGFSHEEGLAIAYAYQFTDCCTEVFLKKAGAPLSAATTQGQGELMNQRTDRLGLQKVTRIWASFHFLPRDLKSPAGKKSKAYKDKYHLICGPNGELAAETVRLAKGRGLEAAGLAMHVLCDTWAHSCFAGTPSLVINNTDEVFTEILPDGSRRPVLFNHNPASKDDPSCGKYTNSIFQLKESSIMNLGHGRAGHLPDYSFARYSYLPAWGGYGDLTKDNPSDYWHAFCQMVKALQYLRGASDSFDVNQYAWDTVKPYETEIREILEKRQLNAEKDWKAFGEKLSGEKIIDFSTDSYESEYESVPKELRGDTALGRYVLAALSQKNMVTGRIFESGNNLAGRFYARRKGESS